MKITLTLLILIFLFLPPAAPAQDLEHPSEIPSGVREFADSP